MRFWCVARSSVHMLATSLSEGARYAMVFPSGEIVRKSCSAGESNTLRGINGGSSFWAKQLPEEMIKTRVASANTQQRGTAKSELTDLSFMAASSPKVYIFKKLDSLRARSLSSLHGL